MKPTPSLFFPLQIEIHCGQDLKQDFIIRFEDEGRMTLKHRGN
jgi:hypothetical protein